MIGRIIVKNAINFSKYKAKSSPWKLLTEKSSKNQNDLTQLWRQWLSLLQGWH